MERGQLTETYRILKNSKWNGLKQETKTALVDDMAMIRPVAKDFEASLNDAREIPLRWDATTHLRDLRCHHQRQAICTEYVSYHSRTQ